MKCLKFATVLLCSLLLFVSLQGFSAERKIEVLDKINQLSLKVEELQKEHKLQQRAALSIQKRWRFKQRQKEVELAGFKINRFLRYRPNLNDDSWKVLSIQKVRELLEEMENEKQGFITKADSRYATFNDFLKNLKGTEDLEKRRETLKRKLYSLKGSLDSVKKDLRNWHFLKERFLKRVEGVAVKTQPCFGINLTKDYSGVIVNNKAYRLLNFLGFSIIKLNQLKGRLDKSWRYAARVSYSESSPYQWNNYVKFSVRSKERMNPILHFDSDYFSTNGVFVIFQGQVTKEK